MVYSGENAERFVDDGVRDWRYSVIVLVSGNALFGGLDPSLYLDPDRIEEKEEVTMLQEKYSDLALIPNFRRKKVIYNYLPVNAVLFQTSPLSATPLARGKSVTVTR